MSSYNIGPRIGIEGEAQFRAQISRINSEYKSMDSYLKTLDRSMAANGKSQEALAAKGNVLRQQLALQEQRFEALSDALAKARERYGDNSQEVMRYEGALLDVKNTQEQLNRELSDTEDEMRRLAEGIEDVGDNADEAEPKVLGFGDVLKAGIASDVIVGGLKRAGDMILDIGQQAIDAAADVRAANAQFSQTFGDLESTATAALRAVSEETGIATTRLQSGYTALYAFTKSVGGDSETALNIAQRALQAAADSAAYYDRTMEDATETLQSFLKGNYENDSALGIAATETSRNAKANELYAKSFQELSESQKVDVLLSMVEAGNKATGALGQAAREADSWVNVTAELSEAWRQLLAQMGSPVLDGLTPIIQHITDALTRMTEPTSWRVLRQGVEEFESALKSADAQLASETGTIAANADLALRYVDRLRELEGAGLDTADAQREYAQTVELLNTLMPELDLTINSVTGRLEQNTWAIEDNIKSLKKQAEQQAKMAYYQEILDAYSKAYQAHYAAEQRLLELETKRDQLLAQGAQAYDTISYAESQATGVAQDHTIVMSEEDKALARVNYELNALRGQYAISGAALEEHAAKVDAATAGYAELSGETLSATEATDALTQAYNAAKSAARDSIDSQIGYFDALDEKSDLSAEKIVKNWEKQKKAFTQYGDNLKKAVELGLDETLVQQLSDGSQQSMLILDELLNGTELTIDEINAAFGGMSDARDSLSGTMAEMEAIANGTYDDMVAAAQTAGYNTVQGLANGVRSNVSILENAMRDMGKKAQIAFNRTMEIQSPSRVMARAGGYVVAGVVQGVERNSRDLEKAMSALATAGQVAYQDQLDHVAQYPSMMQGVPGYGTSTTNNNRTINLGGVSVAIYAQAGQSGADLYDEFIAKLNAEVESKGAAW